MGQYISVAEWHMWLVATALENTSIDSRLRIWPSSLTEICQVQEDDCLCYTHRCNAKFPVTTLVLTSFSHHPTLSSSLSQTNCDCLTSLKFCNLQPKITYFKKLKLHPCSKEKIINHPTIQKSGAHRTGLNIPFQSWVSPLRSYPTLRSCLNLFTTWE